MPPTRRFYGRLAPFWIVVLIIGSLMPFEAKLAMGTRPEKPLHPHDRVVSLKHRAYHWIAFGSTALILLLAAGSRPQMAAFALATVALGVALEIAQHVMYRNLLEWWDMRDDAYGVAAIFLLLLFPRVRRALCADG